MQRKNSIALGAAALLLGAAQVHAGSYSVYVGYADDLRPSPFFPTPWDGSPNTQFIGNTAFPTQYDSGAIRIDNTGASAIVINGVNVSMPWSGYNSGDIWGFGGGITIQPGHSLILAQTSGENFDTSDYGVTQPVGSPLPDGETTHASHVDVTVDGLSAVTYLDTGHVLTTGGFDLALLNNSNESLQWRLIGTTGVTDPGGTQVPDAGNTAALLGFALAGIGFARRRRA